MNSKNHKYNPANTGVSSKEDGIYVYIAVVNERICNSFCLFLRMREREKEKS